VTENSSAIKAGIGVSREPTLPLVCAAYSLGFGLIAAKLFLQAAARSFRSAAYLKYFCLSLPAVVAVSLGEACGYIKNREGQWAHW
jgi:hypothetical protein